MGLPRRYGQSRIDNCPFCGKAGIIKNSQEIPVCQNHKNSELKDLKCLCGEWLDLRQGKWGPYFRCMNCGNINFKKGIEINPPAKFNQQKSREECKEERKEKYNEKKVPKEITVRSDQLDALY